MYVLVDTRNLKLRGVFRNSNEVQIQDDKVVTPTFIITDMNKSNALLNKYEGKLPENWTQYNYYYDRTTNTFRRAIHSGSQLTFVEEPK